MKPDTVFTVAVPARLQTVANAVAAAMWVDIGDDKSFDTLSATDTSGETWAICHSPCTNQFAATLPYFAVNPAALHATAAMVLARDWPDLVIPSVVDIEDFCTNMKLNLGLGLQSFLAENNLNANI